MIFSPIRPKYIKKLYFILYKKVRKATVETSDYFGVSSLNI